MRPRMSGSNHVCRMQRRLNRESVRRRVRRFERLAGLSDFCNCERMSGKVLMFSHTEASALTGLVNGGVLFLMVAKDGTSTSPGISPPSPLDFLLRNRVPSEVVLLSLRGDAPFSVGNGSVILWLWWCFRKLTTIQEKR